MAKRKTWREKLADDKDFPKVVPIAGKMKARWGRGTVAIPAPREVAAHAAEEAAAEGKTRITPYWRTLKTGGELNPKYPGGVEHLRSWHNGVR